MNDKEQLHLITLILIIVQGCREGLRIGFMADALDTRNAAMLSHSSSSLYSNDNDPEQQWK
jgi:hypothetical protein